MTVMLNFNPKSTNKRNRNKIEKKMKKVKSTAFNSDSTKVAKRVEIFDSSARELVNEFLY